MTDSRPLLEQLREAQTVGRDAARNSESHDRGGNPLGPRSIRSHDAEWPQPLDELEPADRPRKLFVEGLPLRVGPMTVAVVGTRRPTAAGVEAAELLTKALVEGGFGIVSGLAMGIDAVAHRTALNCGGYTVAVLGCGLDIDYPQRNRRLREEIAARGTLVTEHPAGMGPLPHHFPQRNRIVAGLSKGVLVVEGGPRSGALITARLALDANRDVWAVPGSLRNAMARGPNALIRTGQAKLVTEPAHIFEELAPNLVWKGGADPAPSVIDDLSDAELAVLHILDDVPVSPQRIIDLTGLTSGAAALALSRLEVRGYAIRRGGGYEISRSGGRLRAGLRKTSEA